jgi:dihydrofolate reductase
MGWMTGFSVRPGTQEAYVASTGAVLGGRRGWDRAAATGGRPYGGAWHGPLFVLTSHPEDAAPTEGVTFLSCGVAEAARTALAAAGGLDVEVHSPTIGRQLLERGLVDRIDLHLAPVLLGDGVRLFDAPGGRPVRLQRCGADDPLEAVDLRYRPARAG